MTDGESGMDETRVEIPQAIRESSFTLSGVPIRCYVLDNGQRILNADDVHALFRAWESGAEILDHEEMQIFQRWMRGAS